MDILRSGQTDNFEYRIIHDDFQLESPREWDDLGTMVCWHKRYNLGDEQPRSTFQIWLLDIAGECLTEKDGHADEWYPWAEYNNISNEQILEKLWNFAHKHYIILPLYLYDHSGISISTSSFNGRAHHAEWDSGQVGWIYVSIADVKEEYGWKNLTQKRRAKIEKYLRNEVETYDQYLTGEVYGYQVFNTNENVDDDKMLDSCYGFYGLDYCEEEARSSMAYYQSEKNKKDDGLERLMVIHANELEKMVSV